MSTTGTAPDKATVGSIKYKSARIYEIALGVLIAVVVVAGIVLLWQHSRKKPTVVHTTKCSQPILKQAAANLDPSKFAALQKITTQIRAIPGYKEDANCMYVLEIGDINIADLANAKTDLTQLKKVYDDQVGYSKVLGFTRNMTTLDGDISFLEKGLKQEQSQTQSFDNPK